MADKHLDTALVNAGRSKKYTQGSVNSVIQRASSLVFDTVEAKKHATRNRANGELFYGRRGTLTHFSLQEAMCELEGGAGCASSPAAPRRWLTLSGVCRARRPCADDQYRL